jgi:hypothetical protein
MMAKSMCVLSTMPLECCSRQVEAINLRITEIHRVLRPSHVAPPALSLLECLRAADFAAIVIIPYPPIWLPDPNMGVDNEFVLFVHYERVCAVEGLGTWRAVIVKPITSFQNEGPPDRRLTIHFCTEPSAAHANPEHRNGEQDPESP